MVFVEEKFADTNLRLTVDEGDKLIGRAEDFEKAIRAHLVDKLPLSKTKEIIISVDVVPFKNSSNQMNVIISDKGILSAKEYADMKKQILIATNSDPKASQITMGYINLIIEN